MLPPVAISANSKQPGNTGQSESPTEKLRLEVRVSLAFSRAYSLYTVGHTLCKCFI